MTERNSQTVLRAEATLLRIPVFGLAVKGSALLDGFEFRYRKRGQDMDLVLRTERDGGSPYPGPLSRRLHMALLHVVAEHGFPFENPVAFTWRDLCGRMGLPNSGRRIGEFKAALRATWGLKLFGLSALDGKADHSPWRRLYVDCRFANEPLDGREPAWAESRSSAAGLALALNSVWLAPWYLDSLNALHSAPVDYELWKRLETVGPIASRLYEFLLPTLYKRETVEIAYERLARAMPVAPQTRPSHAVRQFADALEALLGEGVLNSSKWETMKATGKPKLRLSRGPFLDPRAPLKFAGDEVDRAPATVTAKAEGDTSPEVLERFSTEFYRILGKPYRPYKSDLAVARALIARFGEARAFAVLPDAVKRLKARFRNAETLGALARYFEEAATETVRRQEETQRAQEVAIAQAAQRAKDDGEDRALKETWSNLPQAVREAIRAAVLQEHPSFRRIPSLVEAACIQKLRSDPGLAHLPKAGTETP